MDIEFVKEVTDMAFTISCKEGDKVFDVGEPANYIFVLLKGGVIMERDKEKWYTAKHPGEIIGWSTLISRKEYAASATCVAETELLKIEREPFLKLLEKSPKNKAMLFEHLAKMLGAQLLEVYSSITC
jgi:CRP-like cAMP-binding protein